MIYKITLFDANGPAFASGVVPFFTDDINDFERNYFSEENVKKHRLEKHKERYFPARLVRTSLITTPMIPNITFFSSRNLAIYAKENLSIIKTERLSFTMVIPVLLRYMPLK